MDFLFIDKTTPKQLIDDLLDYLDKNLIDRKLFERKILETKSLKFVLNIDCSWDQLQNNIIKNYKLIYAWLNDDERLLKLNSKTITTYFGAKCKTIETSFNEAWINDSVDSPIEITIDID